MSASVTSMALAGLSQWLVTKIGPKAVMTIGMTLIGTGIMWATRAREHGRFLANLVGPFVVAGAGTAFSFIPISVAALTGVAERQAGRVLPDPRDGPAGWRSVVTTPAAGEIALWQQKR
jgi:predicted enzyme related to lactoylglutathione lyase